MTIALSDLKYSNAANTVIDMTVQIDGMFDGQPFPFTYDPNDPNPVPQMVKEALAANPSISIAPYVPPSAIVPENLSRMQFYAQLAISGIVTKAEAVAGIKGVLPPIIQSAINQIASADEQFIAQMYLSGSEKISRHGPVVTTLATANGWTDTQLDNIWKAAAAL